MSYLSPPENHCLTTTWESSIQVVRQTCPQRPQCYRWEEWSNMLKLVDNELFPRDSDGTGVMHSDWCRWRQQRWDDAHLTHIFCFVCEPLSHRRWLADTKWLCANLSWNRQLGQGSQFIYTIPINTHTVSLMYSRMLSLHVKMEYINIILHISFCVSVIYYELKMEWCCSFCIVSLMQDQSLTSCLSHESNSPIITLILPFISVFTVAGPLLIIITIM